MSITAEEHFWQWFLDNEEELFQHGHEDIAAREILFDRLHNELHKVDENLAFEFSGPQPIREFVITAEGARESFPHVLRLQRSAPALPRWELIAFRPRRDPLTTITIGDLEIRSHDCWFTLLAREKHIGLRLYMPGYTDKDSRYKTIGYLFLDEALGEFDVETKITLLKFHPSDTPADQARYPFEELPARFDKLYDRLNILSGRPS